MYKRCHVLLNYHERDGRISKHHHFIASCLLNQSLFNMNLSYVAASYYLDQHHVCSFLLCFQLLHVEGLLFSYIFHYLFHKPGHTFPLLHSFIRFLIFQLCFSLHAHLYQILHLLAFHFSSPSFSQRRLAFTLQQCYFSNYQKHHHLSLM